ncbi:MAG: hypothetical protein IPI23_09300 [Bacteroidetes bacterium]|nr:hypothetical protein [Bacteroidota bacterium]
MNDQFETHDRLVPYFYTHSLLYLISGILEDEGKEFDAYILGLQRHIIGNYPYDSAQELINTNQFLFEATTNRIAFSQTDATTPDGMKTKSVSHGGFDDDNDTIESIKYFLK